MHPLLQQIRTMAAEDVARYRNARMRSLAIYAIAAVLGLTAYACGVVALVIWLARQGDPVAAAGVTAAGFAALALVALLVLALLNRAERRQRAGRAAAYSAMLGSLAGSTMMGVLARPQALAAGAAVLIAGLAMGLFDRPGGEDAPD
jgi:hypothetical protein